MFAAEALRGVGLVVVFLAALWLLPVVAARSTREALVAVPSRAGQRAEPSTVALVSALVCAVAGLVGLFLGTAHASESERRFGAGLAAAALFAGTALARSSVSLWRTLLASVVLAGVTAAVWF